MSLYLCMLHLIWKSMKLTAKVKIAKFWKNSKFSKFQLTLNVPNRRGVGITSNFYQKNIKKYTGERLLGASEYTTTTLKAWTIFFYSFTVMDFRIINLKSSHFSHANYVLILVLMVFLCTSCGITLMSFASKRLFYCIRTLMDYVLINTLQF